MFKMLPHYFSDNYASGRTRTCCVPGCKNRHSKRHRFPKRESEIFGAWVNRIKPKNYEVLSTQEMYDKYVVCEAHFAHDCIVAGRRGLKRTAIPSLNIPGYEFCESEENGIPEKCPKMTVKEMVTDVLPISCQVPSKIGPITCEERVRPSTSAIISEAEATSKNG